MEYFNMNRKFIRVGGRKAPRGTTEQLIQILDAGLPPLPNSQNAEKDREYLAPLPPEDVLDMRLGVDIDIITNYGLGKVTNDLSRLADWEIEPSIDRVGVAENGVPYALCSCRSDDAEPFAIIIYCDGKTLRGYLPRYGNMLTVPGFEPLTSESDSDMAKNPIFVQKDDGPVEERRFASGDELRAYFWTSGDRLSYKEDACLEDFAARVETIGEMTPEMVEAARKNVTKTFAKYMAHNEF